VTLSARIGLGLVLGIALGLFLGEWVEPLRIVANGYVRLLQMTVLPYVMVSLVAGLGSLDPAAAGGLFTRVGAVLLALWGLALALVLVMPLAFPDWESAAFFSTALLESPEPFDFVGLYIPANPFHSLANNVVPAVVFFSGVVGIALIGVEGKQPFLLWLGVVVRALAGVNRFVVSLSPIGLFAIAAHLAGTIRPEELERIQVYLVAYGVFAALLVFWLVPGLVRVLTPIGWRELFGAARDGLVTAFLTGELFVVLPSLSEAASQLVQRHAPQNDEARTVSDVVVPASFSLPHAGKVLSLSFILFAGWFAEVPLDPVDYPRFAVTGLLASFGSLNAAVPYLLELFRVPADTFQLFLATSLVNSRVGTAVAAMHTLALATAGAWAMQRGISIDGRRLLRFVAVSILLTAAATVGLRVFFSRALEHTYTSDRVLGAMHIVRNGVPVTVHRTPVPAPADLPGASQLERIQARGRLRVGYIEDALPYAFFNAKGDLVGFDVEMAYRLAREIGVDLEFVPVDSTHMAEQLERAEFDLVMSGVAMTPRRAVAMGFSRPYLDEHLAFVVLDHRRKEFTTQESIRALGRIRLGVLNLPYYIEKTQAYAPDAEVVPFETRSALIEAMLTGEPPLDAAVASAERGSAWSLLHPQFSVAVPQPVVLTMPLAYPVARRDAQLLSFLDSWIELKQRDGSIDEARDYWVLGKNAERRGPRWSVIRDVLGWVE
jgi:Na+/H+-dicarboxylate symporter/ABC-type amino acid transport substrate-binding protein